MNSNFEGTRGTFGQLKRYLVIAIQVWGVDFDWTRDHDCSIEINSMKSIVITKAVQIRDFVRATGLIENLEVRFRMVQSDGLIEVSTLRRNEDLFDFEDTLDLVRDELHRRFVAYRASLQEQWDPESVDQVLEATQSKSAVNYAAREALRKFLSCSPGTEMEIDFFRSGKELVQPQDAPPIASRTIDNETEERAAGDVRYFDEIGQKLTLHNIAGTKANIVLEVNEIFQRQQLLWAQREWRQVKVRFFPMKYGKQSDMQSREGLLIAIEEIGDSNEPLL